MLKYANLLRTSTLLDDGTEAYNFYELTYKSIVKDFLVDLYNQQRPTLTFFALKIPDIFFLFNVSVRHLRLIIQL